MACTRYITTQETLIRYVNSLVQEVDNGVISECHVFDAETKLELLEQTWSKIRETQDKLLSTKDLDVTLKYFTDNWYPATMQNYAKVKATLRARINELEPRPIHNSTLNPPAPEPTAPRPQLPVIKPPHFNGDILQWTAFKTKFTSVMNKTGVDSVDKMHFLLQCVHGPAAALIENVDITDDSYETAWNALLTRYENKRVLITAQLNKFFGIPKMTSRSAKEVNNILTTTIEVLSALKTLGSPTDQWDPLVVHFIAQRLDLQTREEWELALGASTDYPGFERMRNFLQGRARALESMEGRTPVTPKDSKPDRKRVSAQASSPVSVHTASVNTRPPSTPSNIQSTAKLSSGNAARPQSPCSCCAESHFIASCPKFHAMSPDDRHKVASSKPLCFNCLGAHPLERCYSQNRCRQCQAAHHTLLHDSRQINSTQVPSPTASDSQSGSDHSA